MDLYNSSNSWSSIGKELGVCGNAAKEQAIKILSKKNNSQLISNQKEYRFKERRNKCRQAWLKMRSEYPMAKKNEIRKMIPTAARWLSINDSDWYKQHNPVCTRKSSSIDWGKRDIEFKAKAHDVVHDILNQSGHPVKITMYSIFQRIGMFIPKYDRYRIPLTMHYIQNVVESTEAFRARRIMWAAKQLIEKRENATKNKLLTLASIPHKFRNSQEINKTVNEAFLWIRSVSKNYEH